MKEKQNRRWGLLLISFLCAFLVWLGVVNVADPVMTNTVEVPVEIINSDVLTKNNLTYAVVGKSTTTVQYEVKTTNAYRIRSSDFRAQPAEAESTVLLITISAAIYLMILIIEIENMRQLLLDGGDAARVLAVDHVL